MLITCNRLNLSGKDALCMMATIKAKSHTIKIFNTSI